MKVKIRSYRSYGREFVRLLSRLFIESWTIEDTFCTLFSHLRMEISTYQCNVPQKDNTLVGMFQPSASSCISAHLAHSRTLFLKGILLCLMHIHLYLKGPYIIFENRNFECYDVTAIFFSPIGSKK